MITLVANLTGSVRKEILFGREHLVAPMTLIVEGILNGSQGLLYYPADEIAANVAAWDGMPLVIRHPYKDGKAISARNATTLESQGVGTVLNTKAQDGKLKAESWFDVERMKAIAPITYNNLEAGRPVELSTGLFTENVPAEDGAVWNGVPYRFVARNYRPDHVAVLPDQRGACSVADGCGININRNTKESSMDKDERKKIIEGLIANSCCWDAEDRGELEKLTDNQLTKVKQQADKSDQQEAVHNEAVKGFTDPGGNDHTWNVKTKAWETKVKKTGEKPKEKPVVNETKAKPITEEDLPQTMREQLSFARTEMERQKAELVDNLTANVADESKEALTATLNTKSLEDLRSLSVLVPKKEETTQNFSGAAGGAGQTNNQTKKLTPVGLPSEYL